MRIDQVTITPRRGQSVETLTAITRMAQLAAQQLIERQDMCEHCGNLVKRVDELEAEVRMLRPDAALHRFRVNSAPLYVVIAGNRLIAWNDVRGSLVSLANPSQFSGFRADGSLLRVVGVGAHNALAGREIVGYEVHWTAHDAPGCHDMMRDAALRVRRVQPND